MSKASPRWVVTRIRGSKPVHLGTVAAKDADDAREKKITELAITDPEIIKRVAARPE
jgi:hypothetical protein